MNTFILTAENRESIMARLTRFLHAWPREKPCLVTVEKFVRHRSNLQNNALWGVAYKVLSEATGFRPPELHEYFLGEHFGWEVYDIMGMKKRRPRRTTTMNENGERDVLSTEAFCDFYAFIQQRAAETVQVNVPDPDPTWFLKAGQK